MLTHNDPSTMSAEAATERMQLRFPPGARAAVQAAAALTGVKEAVFVRTAAVREAERIVRDQEVTILTKEDRRAVMAALDEPIEPSREALAMVEEYRKRVVNAV